MSDFKDHLLVVVRVRPFSQREIARGCKKIVDMDRVTTFLSHPTELTDRKNFSFDHCYWSFDGFKEDQASGRNVGDPSHPRGNQYCDQERLFDDLGRVMLSNMFDGYNTTLFSYGQTGSGKSYSIIGYGSNEGIIPQFYREIFRAIDENSDTSSSIDPIQFRIHLSMMEIYNENVYDLLAPSKSEKGLKVREHPKKGFYADGLSDFTVTSHSEIERLIKQGTLNRTVVATNMNATSSRSHTIVSIGIDQKRTTQHGENTISSVVNIVDLAGSERISKSGTGKTSGERFREGVAINQSLQCLGQCIHALAESSSPSLSNITINSHKNQRIPFRDSVLTKLLMNALGGNSKTIMLASISPADIHYEETLSTLRYADRAKQIRTRATVNQNPVELVREVKGETQQIKSALTRDNMDLHWLKTYGNGRQTDPKETMKDTKKKWDDELPTQLKEKESEIQRIQLSKQTDLQKVNEDITDMVFESKRKDESGGPHLKNVNIDSLLNGRWIHYLKRGITLIGKAQSSTSGIEMTGVGMQLNHAEIKFYENNKVTLRPLTKKGRILVNGIPIEPQVETILQPNDRLVFGATQMWLFRNPILENQASVSDSPMHNYDFLLHEMAAKSGIDTLSRSTDTKDMLQEELVTVIPSIEEANEISAEMNKPVKFEIVLVEPPIVNNSPTKKIAPTQVYVKMKNLDHGTEYIWSKDKFFTRLHFMRLHCMRHQIEINGEEENSSEIRKTDERDPFSEPSDAVVIIGKARIVLQPLAYLVEIEENVPITDLRGIKIGVMKIALLPCADKHGRQLQESDLIDSSDELVGRNLFFTFHIIGCRHLPPQFKDLHCKYKFYGDTVDSKTKMHPYSSHLQFNHSRILGYEPITEELVNYLNHGSIIVELLGRHIMDQNQPFNYSFTPHPMSTKEFLDEEDQRVLSRTGEIMSQKPAINSLETVFKTVDGGKQELLAELQLVKRTHLKLQERLDFIRQMTDRCLLTGQESIQTTMLDAMLNANSSEQAQHIVQQLQIGEDGDEWGDWSELNQQREQKSSICAIS